MSYRTIGSGSVGATFQLAAKFATAAERNSERELDLADIGKAAARPHMSHR